MESKVNKLLNNYNKVTVIYFLKKKPLCIKLFIRMKASKTRVNKIIKIILTSILSVSEFNSEVFLSVVIYEENL
jgi:hypothetical protein